MQMDSAKKLYSAMYSASGQCMDMHIPQTCYSYTSVVINGRLFGTHKSRTAASSTVIASVDPGLFPTSELSSGLRAARIEKVYKHSVTVNGELKTHLLAYLMIKLKVIHLHLDLMKVIHLHLNPALKIRTENCLCTCTVYIYIYYAVSALFV